MGVDGYLRSRASASLIFTTSFRAKAFSSRIQISFDEQ